MEIAREEMAKHGASRLLAMRVRYGALANVVPEALIMAFDAMIVGSADEGARLELVEEPVQVRCHACGHSFSPEGRNALFGLCPACGELAAYKVEQGEGIWLDHLEAE